MLTARTGHALDPVPRGRPDSVLMALTAQEPGPAWDQPTYYRLSIYVPAAPNSCVEALTPNVMTSGGGACGR